MSIWKSGEIGLGGSFSLDNIVLVDPDEGEVKGKRYKTRAAAQTYVATQSPTANNLWTILRGGIDNENLPPIAYCRIVGLGNLTLTGQIDGGAADLLNTTKFTIQNCIITDLNLSGTNMLYLKNCTVSGGIPLGGYLFIERGGVVGVDMSGGLILLYTWFSIMGGTLATHAAGVVIYHNSSFHGAVMGAGSKKFKNCILGDDNSFSADIKTLIFENSDIDFNFTIPAGAIVTMKGGSAKNITIDAGGTLNTDGTVLGTVSGDLSGWNDTGKTALSHILPAQIFS